MTLGDLCTAVAEVTQQPEGGRTGSQILLAIATALEELRPEQLDFTLDEYTLVLDPGQGIYPLASEVKTNVGELPRQVWRILGNPVLDLRDELTEVGAQEIASGADRPGRPACWYFGGEELRLSPVPSRAQTLHIRYHVDHGTPVPVREADGTWGLEIWGFPIDKTWTNPWLQEAWNLVRLRAAAILCVDYLRDAEQGQAYIVRYQEGLRTLQRRRGRRSSPRVRPFNFYE